MNNYHVSRLDFSPFLSFWRQQLRKTLLSSPSSQPPSLEREREKNQWKRATTARLTRKREYQSRLPTHDFRRSIDIVRKLLSVWFLHRDESVSPTHALISSVSLRCASRDFTLFEVGWISGGVFVVCAVVNNSSLHKKTKNKNKIIHRLICNSVTAVLKCFPHTIKMRSIASLPVRSEAELTLSGQRFSSFSLLFSPRRQRARRAGLDLHCRLPASDLSSLLSKKM